MDAGIMLNMLNGNAAATTPDAGASYSVKGQNTREHSNDFPAMVNTVSKENSAQTAVSSNISTAENADSAVLVISDQGRVEGDVYVAYAVINGEVVGNVYASEKLELSAKARISGNVEYNLLEMASGAEINGQMLHKATARKLPENPIEKSKEKDNIHRLDDTTATVAGKS